MLGSLHPRRCHSFSTFRAFLIQRKLGTRVNRVTSDLVRRRDHASFLAAFFYPAHVRDQYLSLRAFNLELASISEEVSSRSAGFLRLQWWRQALASSFEVS